jgi:hypothetical protein
MTLQLIPSEFPYIRGKFDFLFYQCRRSGGHEDDGRKNRGRRPDVQKNHGGHTEGLKPEDRTEVLKVRDARKIES